MKKPILFIPAILSVFVALFSAAASAGAGALPDEDILAHGKYIATIAGCTTCHTPYKTEYSNPKTLTVDQIRVIAFNELEATDTDRLLSGSRAFDLGPAGIVFSKNITPNTANGIGIWTDEQIKTAIKTGVANSGEILFPVMPYHVYNTMADTDVDAVVAYLRSVKAVDNPTPKSTVSHEGLQALPYTTGITAPDASDKMARGAYLVNSVMGCTDCHTPIDAATGTPQMDKYLGGGQPYEGPWGIVYGGNITPDAETGLGSWSEAEIRRAITSGVSKDGRKLILMPWFAYANLTNEDADAIAYYLKNGLKPISNEVPKASLNKDFIVMASGQETQTESKAVDFTQQPIALVIAGLVVIALISIVIALLRRKSG